MDGNRYSWRLVEPGRALEGVEGAARVPEEGEVVVSVAGCGVCHTDIGFADGHVATRAPLPLVLGHEIAGTVTEAGSGADEWVGRDVLVPAVIPCGECEVCAAGRGNVCKNQKMPGNDLDGGFATHVTVPAVGLTSVETLPEGYELADLAVVADAVTTPLQAVRRARVAPGELVVVVGTGGVGTYAVQVAAASGAAVIALDVDDARLAPLLERGAAAAINVGGLSSRQVRDAVREHVRDLGAPASGWKIFECSGTGPGQETSFGLLVSAATLAVVGYSPKPVSVRLSNLMAFDADAFGSWGCPPELYPEAVELVRSGRITLLPFIQRMPLRDIATAFAVADEASQAGRIILTP